MDQKTIVIAGAGVGVVLLVLLARGGSTSGTSGRLTTLGPLPRDTASDAALLSARSSAFGSLARITESLGLEGLRADNRLDLARIQAQTEGSRIAAAERASYQQQLTQRQAAARAESTQKHGNTWDTITDIGEKILDFIF